MFRYPTRRVGPLTRRADRELAGVLLALVDSGCVIAYPPFGAAGHRDGEHAWGMQRPTDGPTTVRDLPGGCDRGRDRRGFDYLGRPAELCYSFLAEGWIVLGDPDDYGIRTVALTGLGEQWLDYCRGNHGAFDLALIPAAFAAVEVERAAFRVYCEDHGIEHGHQDAR